MEFYFAAATDPGIKRKNNQDNLFVEQFGTEHGSVAFAILCDGMGGLEHGEIASAMIVDAFSVWARDVLPLMEENTPEDHVIREQWTRLISEQNAAIRSYGLQHNCTLGSTVTALLMTAERFYVLNIGDSRAYEISDTVRQITEDHTVIANEIRLGNISEEQAKKSPIKNVLTKCVGVAERVYPDLFFGDTRSDAVYMLCSDGFRHCVGVEEMQEKFYPQSKDVVAWLKQADESLIELNKQRGETDNISVVTIYTKG